MRLPIIVALDLGLKTGFAIREADGKVFHGMKDFNLTRFDGGGIEFLNFRLFLNGVKKIVSGPIEAIYYEGVRMHAGTQAAQMYGGFSSGLQTWCLGQKPRISYQAFGVGEIKKFATGKGNASKSQVMEAMRAKGYDVIDDNNADALAILLLAIHMRNET